MFAGNEEKPGVCKKKIKNNKIKFKKNLKKTHPQLLMKLLTRLFILL